MTSPLGPRQALGILRSILIYYGVPFRRRRLREFYRAFVRPGDLCFDVGAHVGNRVRAFRDLGARVVALEPQSRMVALLERWYGDDPLVTILPKGVGRTPGTSELFISSRHPTVTTFSADWIEDVRKDSRFDAVTWDEKATVELVTLDQLIERFGEPAFCKIDVEGFEEEVLLGLSRPLPALSFEFIPAARERAFRCIALLEALGDYEFNWSLVETMRFASPRWVRGAALRQAIEALPFEGPSGDVYARLVKRRAFGV